MEQLIERCAGLDVYKETVAVCVQAYERQDVQWSPLAADGADRGGVGGHSEERQPAGRSLPAHHAASGA